jgi:hypothetical protein
MYYLFPFDIMDYCMTIIFAVSFSRSLGPIIMYAVMIKKTPYEPIIA